VRLVGIHRPFIACLYRRGYPAATPDRSHNSVMAAGFYLGPLSASSLLEVSPAGRSPACSPAPAYPFAASSPWQAP
jgi:hypothetical protein